MGQRAALRRSLRVLLLLEEGEDLAFELREALVARAVAVARARHGPAEPEEREERYEQRPVPPTDARRPGHGVTLSEIARVGAHVKGCANDRASLECRRS